MTHCWFEDPETGMMQCLVCTLPDPDDNANLDWPVCDEVVEWLGVFGEHLQDWLLAFESVEDGFDEARLIVQHVGSD